MASQERSMSRRGFLAGVAGVSVAVSGISTGSLAAGSATPAGSALESLLGPGTTVRVSPDEVWRESPVSIEFVITLGKEGLAAGDSLGLVNGSYIDRWKFGFPNQWWGQEPPWQVDDAARPNHASAVCGRDDVTLALKVGESGGKKPYCNQPGHFARSLKERMRYVLEISASEGLKEGDTITVRWTNATTPLLATHYFFLPFLFSRLPQHDRELPIRQSRYTDLPSIRVRGRDAARLHVTCPALVSVGEPFHVNIAAVDEYGNPAEDFEGEVRLDADPNVVLPESVQFSNDDMGCKRVQGLRVNTPGWYRVSVSSGATTGQSNYVVASAEPPAERLYFGDMHTHTLDCDGTVDMLGHFDYAPRVAGLDFGAVSCHAEYFGCADAWERYLDETTRANRPGEFVTFYGYEWANQGHTNAYFLNADQTTLIYGPKLVKNRAADDPAFRTPCETEGDYMRMLRAHEHPVFCIAHCHTKYGEGIDDNVLWLDEIYSCHKRDRVEREAQLRRNLARGLRLGVVAGSDMHRLTMGHLCKDPGPRWPQEGGWESSQYQTGGAPGHLRAGTHPGGAVRRHAGAAYLRHHRRAYRAPFRVR
jgi:hypothetical protein